MSFDDQRDSFTDRILDGWHNLGVTTQVTVLLSVFALAFLGGVYSAVSYFEK